MHHTGNVRQADVVIAGSGPGGATVAREMAKAGKKVILCEKGAYHRGCGLTLSMISYFAKFGFTFSKEGAWVLRPQTVGGATSIFMGTSWMPPAWLKDKYGIDVTAECTEFWNEVPIKPLSERLMQEPALRIMDAARSMGIDWNPINKMMRHDKCVPGCCKCSSGCPVPGARWTAREYVEEAWAHGAELLIKTDVKKVLTENGKAVGVVAVGPDGNEMHIMADTVVISAGGQGTPPIMQRSGIYDAGKGFFADPLWLVWAPTSRTGTNHCVPMSGGVNYSEDGFVMTDIGAAFLFWAGTMLFKWPFGALEIPKALANWNNMYVIMIKCRDSLDGMANIDESFSKPIDYKTMWQLNKATALSTEILVRTGCKPKDISNTCIVAAHPGGTMRIGNLLDKDCQSPIKNCYCMDTSIIPEPWGLPPVVTLVGMAKRLSKKLLGVGAKKEK
jgi:hypothetical protein